MFTDENGRLALFTNDDGTAKTVKIERRGVNEFPENKKLTRVKVIEDGANESKADIKQPNFLRRLIKGLGL